LGPAGLAVKGRHLRRLITAAVAVLVAILLGATMLLIERMRQTALRTASDTVERAARVVELAVTRQFLSVDSLLAGLPAILAALPHLEDGKPELRTVDRLLLDLSIHNLAFRNLLLAGPDGVAWAAALPGSRHRALPFDPAALQGAVTPGAIAVLGPAFDEGTGVGALYLTRQITAPGYGISLAVAQVPVDQLVALLAPYGALRGLNLTVERRGGPLIAATTHGAAPMPRVPALATPEPLMPEKGEAAESGRTSPPADPARAVRAVRPTPYADIDVTASIDRDLALSEWRRDRAWLVSGMLGVVALLGGCALAVNRGIRARERSEAALARTRLVLENALESLADGLVIFDPDDRLLICNQRYRDFYRVSAPFIVPGVHFADLIREGARRGQYPQAGEDIEAFVREVQAWHRGDRPPLERLLPDGRWMLVTERRTPDGGTVGIRTDITALKNAMAGLAAARDAAAAATEAKSRFLARMSHELRTPLAGVLGLAQVLARDPSLPEGARLQARTLELAGQHLLAVANDVLDLSRIEAGTLALQPAPTALAALLESCVTMVRPAAEERGAELHVSLDPSLPASIVVDVTRLRQLLLNLLSNAIKFSPKGGRVELRVSAAATTDRSEALRIEVRDEGPGVPAAQRSAIFSDFVQIEHTGTADGAGLGLAIAALIVERMEGCLGYVDNAEARSGHGAVFWVELPLIAAPQPSAEVSPADAQVAKTGRSLRLLVADDVPANLLVARALLESAGHQVDEVTDGAAALAALAAADAGTGPAYDAVLMDVMMPGMDGTEAAQRIRALGGAASRVPILAVTASAYPEDLAACLAAGMDDYVVKPIDRESLLRKLAALTSAGPADATLPGDPALRATAQFGCVPLLGGGGGHAPRPLIPGLDDTTAFGVLPEFLREIRALREELRHGAWGPPEIAEIGHRLAGAAASLGAERLAVAARALETAARRAPSGSAAQLVALQGSVLAVIGDTLAALESAAVQTAPGLAA
jgi:signal transduction histidine kinase/AmiR/NasT family two-component response regulator/HPt (histidine-containing phosphotransfer) domain-containing protein